MSSPDGQVSGMAGKPTCAAVRGWPRACHPDDLPEGYHAASRGQAWRRRPPAPRQVAPLTQRDRATPGRRDGTRATHSEGEGEGPKPIQDLSRVRTANPGKQWQPPTATRATNMQVNALTSSSSRPELHPCKCEFESHRGHSPTRYFLSTAACPHAVLPHLPRRDPGRWHRRPTMPEGLLEPFQHLPPRAPTEHLRTYPRGVASTAAHTDEP